MSMDEPAPHGRFPFGRPNSVRPMRTAAGEASAIVVGVYPSAFHVAWSPPPSDDPRDVSARRRPFIASLAVDVEPTVFWDGADPSPDVLLERWKAAVGFRPDAHGSVSVGTNGPSGASVTENVLKPLGLSPARVAFTDAVPWFFVKPGAIGQAEAIGKRFGPSMRNRGVHLGSLPTRPKQRQLIELVRAERVHGLRSELVASRASLVITLGQEALDAVCVVADSCSGVSGRLRPEGYGERGEVRVGSDRFELLPLVHPGFRRQTTNAAWLEALEKWRMREHRDTGLGDT